MSVKEIQHGNVLIRITRPTLTEEERKKREANIERTLQIIGKELIEKGAT